MFYNKNMKIVRLKKILHCSNHRVTDELVVKKKLVKKLENI